MRTGLAWLGLLLLTLASAPAEEPGHADLAGLFAKPPADLVGQLAVSDDQVATLWRLPDGGARLGLAVRHGAAWSLPLANVKALDVAPPLTLRLLALRPRHPQVLAISGADRVNLVAVAAGRLSFLLAADTQVSEPAEAADIDDDGQSELLLTTRAVALWPGVGPWRDREVTAYRIGPDGSLSRALLVATSDERLERLSAAYLWPRAVALATLQVQQRPSEATRWNLALTRWAAGGFEAQADSLRLGSSAEQRVASAACEVLAGHLDQAAARLLSFGGVSRLPTGWATPLARLAHPLNLARDAAPELADDADYVVLSGFVALAKGDEPAARGAWRRATELRQNWLELEPWLATTTTTTATTAVSRLWWLDAADGLHAVDLTEEGTPARPPRPLTALGPMSALAGRPNVPGVALLSADARSVVYTVDDRSARPLARGDALDLAPDALSPDGHWLVVANGIQAEPLSRVVRVADGAEALRLDTRGRCLWSPDSAQLAMPVRGGIELVNVPGGQRTVLVRGDEATLWLPLDWEPGRPLRAMRHSLVKDAAGEVHLGAARRLALEPGAEPVADDRPWELDDLIHAVMLRTRPGEMTQPLTVTHPTLLAWRAARGDRTMLMVGPRAEERAAVEVAATEPLDHRLRAAWSRAPEALP